MSPKHEGRVKYPKPILKHRRQDRKPSPKAEAEPEPPPLPARPNEANPSIRNHSRKARRLLRKIKEDQSPVASFFGMAKLRGSAADLHKLLKEEGNVRTGERDIRRLFKGDSKKWKTLLQTDAELPEKTVQAKTEFVSINNQFNKIVVSPLEKTFKSHGRSKPDYDHLRKQAELLLGQAKEARRSLKKAVKDARKRNSASLDPSPPQFDIRGSYRRKHSKRYSRPRQTY
ncbi:hypothetical protein GTA08_BOTSDO05326 [Neofusicoccum parvum]|uniref:Uncharacterized protein n=2 Tax=Neofusicoccum parvum TaxID=310453 RepID=R1GEM2_BOTPV|nr:hypothetical protein UCRNP2_6555 [Neofusicoccum parvum UCRNP2]GME37179.1 hypothetical protein GTA08_BOTSDO05326 [Neofusicoccum parvum]GME52888.1 hypothetical protein GTA08_BOTSDO05326 [Neofusicoccum parvum]